MRTHPHADATYRVVRLSDGVFSVEVMIPDRYPATVTSFDSEAAAAEWIARDKRRIETEAAAGSWLRRSRPYVIVPPRSESVPWSSPFSPLTLILLGAVAIPVTQWVATGFRRSLR
jgi:hypothetical protein